MARGTLGFRYPNSSVSETPVHESLSKQIYRNVWIPRPPSCSDTETHSDTETPSVSDTPSNTETPSDTETRLDTQCGK